MTEYRMLRTSDIPEAVEISKRQLGVDYLDDGDFEDAMSDSGQFCVVAEEGGRVAGFSICQVFGPELEGEKLMLPDCPERDLVMSTPLTGLLDSVAVSADFKGKGIGTELGRRCIEEMRARGCGIVCAMAWKNIHGVTNIAKVLERLGLRETVAIQGYWNLMVDSPEGHDCPICGAPCRCWGSWNISPAASRPALTWAISRRFTRRWPPGAGSVPCRCPASTALAGTSGRWRKIT